MRLVGVRKAVTRLAVAAALFGVLAPMVSLEAAAGFGVTSPGEAADADKAAAGSKGGNTYTKEEIQAREEARKRAEEEAEKNPAPPRPPARAKVVKPVPVPVVKKDEEVVHSIAKKPGDKH